MKPFIVEKPHSHTVGPGACQRRKLWKMGGSGRRCLERPVKRHSWYCLCPHGDTGKVLCALQVKCKHISLLCCALLLFLE